MKGAVARLAWICCNATVRLGQVSPNAHVTHEVKSTEVQPLTNAKLFAVIRTRGDSWRDSVSLENQQEWDEHAVFMNALKKEGFIVLGGPLEGTRDVLLIVRANTPDEINDRFRDDPWTSQDLLRISRIAPWTVRLGSLP